MQNGSLDKIEPKCIKKPEIVLFPGSYGMAVIFL